MKGSKNGKQLIKTSLQEREDVSKLLDQNKTNTPNNYKLIKHRKYVKRKERDRKQTNQTKTIQDR